MNLNNFKSNVYSQYGEDGILEILMSYIEPSGFVIEFGAADGTIFSNTAKLWKDDISGALLIEPNVELFSTLNTFSNERVKCVNSLVENIDDFTTEVADICSIDVDGNDYHIAQRMQTPHKIVVIEYNPTIPVHVEMVGEENTMQGSSALSVTKMMNEKGYTLVACTKSNLIFLLNYRESWGLETNLSVLFDTSCLNYIVTSADGYYDTIGEFGYGMEAKAKFSFNSTNPLDRTKRFDAVMRERIRQYRVNYLTDKEFVEEVIAEFEQFETES